MKKAIATILAASALVVPQVSFATTTTTTDTASVQDQVIVHQGTWEEFKQNMTDLGIDPKTQEKLLAKKQKGELLDSEKPENRKKYEKEMQVTHSEKSKKHVFNDGSVWVASLTGGTSQCGTGYCSYRGVTVSSNWLGVSASFKADYTIVQGTSNKDSISSAYQPAVTTYGATATTPVVTVTRADEYIGSYRSPAEAQWVSQVQTTGSAVSSTFYLWLRVSADQATESHN